MQIDYSEFAKAHSLTFTGRNGTAKCCGLTAAVNPPKTRITIAPITSRGSIGRCDIDIPATAAAVDQLKQLLDAALLEAGQGGGAEPEQTYKLNLDATEFKAQRQMLSTLFYSGAVIKGLTEAGIDPNLLEGLMNLTDAIADQANDNYGLDVLCFSNEV
jgi:hypothetical protein